MTHSAAPKLTHPRVCDAAGRALSTFPMGRHPFDLDADMVTRDKARYAVIAHWRKENGLPPLKEKTPKPPTRVAPD